MYKDKEIERCGPRIRLVNDLIMTKINKILNISKMRVEKAMQKSWAEDKES